jgi:hypothetical protein
MKDALTQLEQLVQSQKREYVMVPVPPPVIPLKATPSPLSLQLYIDIAEKAKQKAERLERENLEVRSFEIG